jgi:hypothetical protein
MIKERLGELGLDQRDLAAAVQVTDSYISQLLTRRKAPSRAGAHGHLRPGRRILEAAHRWPDASDGQCRERISLVDFVALLKKGPRPPIRPNPMGHSPHQHNRPQIVLALSPNRSDDCDDRNPVKEKLNERKRNR